MISETATALSRIRNDSAYGMDAVLLSGFARAKKQERCLDLGCGNGIIPILMEAKTEGKHFTGLEIQPKSADMAGDAAWR